MQTKNVIIVMVLIGVALFVIPYVFRKQEIPAEIPVVQVENTENVANTEKVVEKSVEKSPATSVSRTINANIESFTFAPAEIVIKKGDTVVWKNKDAAPHTVTGVTEGDLFGSDILNKSDAYSFTFKKAGTFTYRCKLHPSMKGVIKVTD